MMVDNNLLKERLRLAGQIRSIDLNIGPEMILLRHFSSC